MSAGDSGTALVEKLGRAGHSVAYVNPPESFGELVGELPDGGQLMSNLDGALDLIVWFVTERRVRRGLR